MTTDSTPQVEAVIDPTTGHIVTADRQWAWVNDAWVPAASVGVTPAPAQEVAPVAASAVDPYTEPQPIFADEPEYLAPAAPAATQAAAPSAAEPSAAVQDEPSTFVLDTSRTASSTGGPVSFDPPSGGKRRAGGSRGIGGNFSGGLVGKFALPTGNAVDSGFLGLLVPLTLLAILGGLGVAGALTGWYVWSNLDVLIHGALSGVTFGDDSLMSDPMEAASKADAIVRNAKILATLLSLLLSSTAAYLAFRLGKVNAAILGGPAVGIVTVAFGWLGYTVFGSSLAATVFLVVAITLAVGGYATKVGRTE